jgi:hypothetical protein
MSDKALGWIWLPAHTEVKVGQTLTAARLVECVSPRALDALQYARGATICRTDSSGKVLAMADATTVLHEFMCWSGEQALLGEREAGREPDKQSWAAIEAKRKWLKGEATDEELDAAGDAAWDAEVEIWEASYVTSDVALAAAGAAARAAASAATWVATRDAAWAAAWAAARDATWVATSKEIWKATWDAARDAQNAKLEEMLNDLLKEGKGK